MKPIPLDLAEKVWKVASHVDWTVEDWKDYYESLTACFLRIAARHAKQVVQSDHQSRDS